MSSKLFGGVGLMTDHGKVNKWKSAAFNAGPLLVGVHVAGPLSVGEIVGDGKECCSSNRLGCMLAACSSNRWPPPSRPLISLDTCDSELFSTTVLPLSFHGPVVLLRLGCRLLACRGTRHMWPPPTRTYWILWVEKGSSLECLHGSDFSSHLLPSSSLLPLPPPIPLLLLPIFIVIKVTQVIICYHLDLWLPSCSWFPFPFWAASDQKVICWAESTTSSAFTASHAAETSPVDRSLCLSYSCPAGTLVDWS